MNLKIINHVRLPVYTAVLREEILNKRRFDNQWMASEESNQIGIIIPKHSHDMCYGQHVLPLMLRSKLFDSFATLLQDHLGWLF